jgi:TPR repeat protein
MKAILRTGFLTLAIMLVFAYSANAGSLEDGSVAYARGNYAMALKFWQPHAEQGHAEAQNNLGVIYANGRGVPRDDVEAVKWYRKAGEQGNAVAQFNLGVSYMNGWGVPLDYVSAHKWFDLVAASDNEKGHRFREEVAKRMTPDQIAEAQRMAREWMAKHQQ